MKRDSRINLAVTLFVGLLCIGSAQAMHPDNHHHITRAAATVYQECLKAEGIDDSLGEGMEAIIEYSGKEDVSPFITRALNWHFHDAFKDDKSYAMGRHITGARKSMHKLFDRHGDSLFQAIREGDSTEVYELTGRILHYVQDVTVPAHVAPNFHYSFLFFDHGDYFDDMPEWQTASFVATAQTCDLNKADSGNLKQRLNQILDTTANSTRSRILQRLPLPQNHNLAGETWEVFWVVRRPEDDDKYENTIKGFAPYGAQGNAGFEQLCNGTAVERAVCLAFFNRSYNEVISATVQTLLLVNAVLTEHE